MIEQSNGNSGVHVVVAALYKFVNLPDYRDRRADLYAVCKENRLKGTILLAEEGINGTLAGSRAGIDNLREFLNQDGRFDGLDYKESIASAAPFHRLKIKLKKEIVTMGREGIQPSRLSGTRVEPERWNSLLEDPEVLVLDTRNQYEYEVGTFLNAVSPELKSFREFPEYVQNTLDPGRHRKIAMFCTGGIRCEKASAFMLQQGFSEVYQLQGGILRYLQEVKPGDNLWQGECFVFDGRVAVDSQLHEGEYQQCYSCRRPLSPKDRQSDKYEQGIACPHCYDSLTPERRASLKERQRQVELAAARNQLHVGAMMKKAEGSQAED